MIDLTAATETPHVLALVNVVNRAYEANHYAHNTLSDCVELWAHTLHRYNPGEEELYMETVGRMQPEAVNIAAEGFALLLQHFTLEGCYSDLLGPVYQGLADRWKRVNLGQYFTPWDIAIMMTEMLAGDINPEADPPTVHEPAVGSGVMLLAFRGVVAQRFGRHFASRCCLTGQDIDPLCVNMSLVQLALTNDIYMSNFLLAFRGELETT